MSVWKRKPDGSSPYDDLFECYKCKEWRPWYHFTMAANVEVRSYNDFKDIILDDGGWLHACNNCVKTSCQKLVRV